MKKTICIVLAVVIGLLGSGCASSKKTEGENEQVVLHIGLPSGDKLTPWAIVEGFQKEKPNITLEIDETPWVEYMRKLKLQLAGGTPPGLFLMDSGFVMSMGMNGALLDLSDRVKKDIKADDYSAALFAGKDPDGKLWGIPHALNSAAVFYNKKMFDDAGIPYPTDDWTYDEMFEIAKKLTVKDPNSDGRNDKYGLGLNGNITIGWLPFVTATGGAPLDETRTKSMFTDPKTIEGMKKLVDASTDDTMCAPTDWVNAMGGHQTGLYKNQLAMIINQTSLIGNLNRGGEVDFDVAPIPIGWDGKRHVTYVPNFLSISKAVPESEQNAAWEFLEYYLSDEPQRLTAEQMLAGIPIKKTALEYLANRKDTSPANIKAFYEYLDDCGVTLYENKTWTEWEPKVTETVREMCGKRMSFDEGMAKIEKDVSLVLGN